MLPVARDQRRPCRVSKSRWVRWRAPRAVAGAWAPVETAGVEEDVVALDVPLDVDELEVAVLLFSLVRSAWRAALSAAMVDSSAGVILESVIV